MEISSKIENNVRWHSVKGVIDIAELSEYLLSDEDIASIYEENARAHRRGINSVPSFVFAEAMAISGAHEPQVLARMLDAAAVAA